MQDRDLGQGANPVVGHRVERNGFDFLPVEREELRVVSLLSVLVRGKDAETVTCGLSGVLAASVELRS